MIGGRRVVLIMDEVDGMSGGDRGGSAHLASLIRKAKVSVLFLCMFGLIANCDTDSYYLYL